jgi:tetratricopeptide (TPR) repeat protein
MPERADPAATAREENVLRLRELHAGAGEGDRPQAALLLGLAIADLAAHLPDDDPRLPELAREGMLRLEERDAVADPPAIAAAAEQARQLLGKLVPEPQPAAGLRWVPEGLNWRGQTIDPQQVRHLAETARMMLRTVPEGHEMRAQLQVMVGVADAMDVLSSGRWTAEHDTLLATLREDASAASGPGGEMAVVAQAFVALLQGLRCQARSQSPRLEGRPGPEEFDEAIAGLEAAVDGLSRADTIFREFAAPLRAMAGILLVLRVSQDSEGTDDSWDRPVADSTRRLLARAREHLGAVPPELCDVQPALAAIAVMEQGLEADDQTMRDLGGAAETYQELFDMSGGGLPRAEALARRARQTMDLGDIAAAIRALRDARRGLAAGHPAHASLLAMLASLLGLQASLTQSADDTAEAIDAGIAAIRAADRPSVEVAGHLVAALMMAMTMDLRAGPFEQAETALEDAFAAAGRADTWLRLCLSIGIGAARLLRWRTSRNDDLGRRARQALDTAEQLLPEAVPTDQWVAPAWTLFSANASQAMLYADAEAGAAAGRLADRLEQLLVENPELADRMAGHMLPGGLAALNLGSGGQGMLQALRTMKATLPMLSGLGSFNMGTGQDAVWTHVSAVMGRVRQGRMGEPIDLAAMAKAVMAEMRNDPAAFRDAMSAAMGVPVPPPPPAAADTGRLASRALERAVRALGADGPPGSARRPLAPADRPESEALHGVVADLRTALEGGLDDASLRRRAHGVLGACLAELHWLGDDGAGQALPDAIAHLDRSLAGSEHALPTVERADLLDVLARCQRESVRLGLAAADSRLDAERTARAALRELARCVLVADGTEQALQVAARANEIVARVVGWCLADDRPRAAVEVAEAGRSLVLASVVLAGRAEELLRGDGQHAVADAWRRGDEQGRLAGLSAVSASIDGQFLLTTPTADQVSQTLLATAMDAVVYLVPPAPSDASGAPGRGLLVRPGFHVDVLDLRGVTVGPGTPLADYLAAFTDALGTHDPSRRNPGGFRGTPQGQAWANALADLGSWTHTHIVGPLVEHTRGWPFDRTPHLALVPLGELAAIPYAAAWASDPAVPGGRRYAVHDLVLTHTVSARLLTEVARRPRLPLTERVILVNDPTGEFPYARAIAKALARQLYPHAEVYGRGRGKELTGPATTSALLAALPAEEGAGASLLHLSTHATTNPTAQLQAVDGWLPLARILERARGRPPHAAGGLVVTSACLTDSTNAHYDESVTLATALLAAGATGVIGTRWPIDDDTTATLAHYLHHHLADGHQPAHALRLAQLDLLDPAPRTLPGLHPHLAALPHSRLAHPASWAGYVHHGR